MSTRPCQDRLAFSQDTIDHLEGLTVVICCKKCLHHFFLYQKRRQRKAVFIQQNMSVTVQQLIRGVLLCCWSCDLNHRWGKPLDTLFTEQKECNCSGFSVETVNFTAIITGTFLERKSFSCAEACVATRGRFRRSEPQVPQIIKLSKHYNQLCA